MVSVPDTVEAASSAGADAVADSATFFLSFILSNGVQETTEADKRLLLPRPPSS